MEQRWLVDAPGTAAAFAESALAERSWLADLLSADLADRRPDWLQDLWSGLDRGAGMPGNGTAGIASVELC
jgi:hypothetical protein